MALYPSLHYGPLDSLISQFEGFGSSAAPTITAANNPGAIQAGSFATSMGAVGESNGFAVFPDLASGTAALDELVSRKISGGIDTPAEFAESWAPSGAAGNSPASTANYANFLAHGLGIGTGDTIPQVSATDAISAPGAVSTGPGSTSGQSGSWLDWDPLSSIIPGYGSAKAAVGSAVGSATGAAVSAANFWSNLSLAQITILILGIVIVVAGLFFLRPVQKVVTATVDAGKRGAALFA